LNADSAAIAFFRELVIQNRAQLRLVAHWGDGRCGAMLEVLQQELLTTEELQRPARPLKEKIPRALAKQVFERDGYRCVTCSGWIDLTCDHVVPESKGGPTTLENLQTMCRPCNTRKGTGP
jgi:hypothetical protein